LIVGTIDRKGMLMGEPATRPKFYPLVYYMKEKDLGKRRFETQIHKTRDGLALAELSPLLFRAGYTYGGTILNVPMKTQRSLVAEGRLKETRLKVESTDVVLLATRPALDDDEEQERPLLPSGCAVESAAFAALRRFFATCDRAEVILASEVVLEERNEYLRAVHFRQNQGGRIRFFDTPTGEIEPTDPQLTVGYLVGVPNVSPTGARLAVVFGMGGTETLWLCHLFRTRLADEFHQTLTTPDPRIRLIAFSVPDYAPFPLFGCDPEDVRAEIIVGHLAR
jgi:hypothetical protein